MSFSTGIDEDDELDAMDDDSQPVSTLAGPQTTRSQVMQRIADVRNPAGAAGPAGAASPASPDEGRDAAALRFARDNAATAGVGRALNALSAGTGYKPDDSGYAAIEKQSDLAMKELDRSASIRKAIEERKSKEAMLNASLQARKQDQDANREINRQKLSAYDKRTETMGDVAHNRVDTANIRAANTILGDKNAQTEVKKLQASRSAQSLVDDIRAGKLTDSKNVARQLTNMIATIELGNPGGQGDRQAMGVDTLYGKLKGALGYVEGKPEGVIPNDYLNQLESEVHALGDRAAANYKNITDGQLKGADLSMGNPDADAGKVYQLAKNRRDQLMSSNGYDPESGSPLGRPAKSHAGQGGGGGLINDANAGGGRFTSDDLKALQYIKNNPGDPLVPQLKQKLKSKGLVF